MIGDVKGKTVLLVDDLLDTGGTIVNAAKLISNRGAKKILVMITHGIFSGNVVEKINGSVIDELILTDTIPFNKNLSFNKKVKIVSISGLLSEAIKNTHEGISLSEVLII
jgi:ribose-phosphate pyrophosphokinase